MIPRDLFKPDLEMALGLLLGLIVIPHFLAVMHRK